MKIYEHEFLAICPKGHKRNFNYITESKDLVKHIPLDEYVLCPFCNDFVTYSVVRYLKNPMEKEIK